MWPPARSLARGWPVWQSQPRRARVWDGAPQSVGNSTSTAIGCGGFRALFKKECFQTGVDYVPLDTSMQFDKALLEYLINRQQRG
jgi:hypothetical protein